MPIRLQGIKIGKDCWIGAKVTILDGTVLGDGAVLNGKEYPKNSIIGGVPAKVEVFIIEFRKYILLFLDI